MINANFYWLIGSFKYKNCRKIVKVRVIKRYFLCTLGKEMRRIEEIGRNSRLKEGKVRFFKRKMTIARRNRQKYGVLEIEKVKSESYLAILPSIVHHLALSQGNNGGKL